jgi:hypothetical protein
VIAVGNLDAAVPRWAVVTQTEPLIDRHSAVFDIGGGSLRVADTTWITGRFPGVEPPSLPWPAALRIDTDDLTAARRALAGTPHRAARDRVWADPRWAGGAIVEFREPA